MKNALDAFTIPVPKGTLIAAGEVVKAMGTYPTRVVLCLLEHNEVTPYATWLQVIPPDAPSYLISGDYHASIQVAATDYAIRRRKFEPEHS